MAAATRADDGVQDHSSEEVAMTSVCDAGADSEAFSARVASGLKYKEAAAAEFARKRALSTARPQRDTARVRSQASAALAQG